MKWLRRNNLKKRKISEETPSNSIIFLKKSKRSKLGSVKSGRRFRRIKNIFRFSRKKLLFFLILLAIAASTIGGTFLTLKIFGEHKSFVSPLVSSKSAVSHNQEAKELISRELHKKNINFLTISENEQGYAVALENNSVVLINPEKNIVQQIASLQVILGRLTMEGKQFHKLDLRFDKPVIVY